MTHHAPATGFAPNFAATFAGIVDLLCRAVAAHGPRTAFAAPVIVLLWSRLRRAARRIDALASALAAGTPLPPPRKDPRRNRPRRTHGTATPRRFAWLLPLPEAATAASRLRTLIADPAFAPLMESDARFGRILRPLCHSLGIAQPEPLRRITGNRPRKPPPPPRHRNYIFAPPGARPPRLTRWNPGRASSRAPP